MFRTCRDFGIGRSSFCCWNAACVQRADAGLINEKPIPKNPANQTPPEIVEKVLPQRSKYHLGPIRILWYLALDHGVKISDAGVTRILRRNGLGRLPRGTRLRKIHTRRYNIPVPGHHIQTDVKFLTFTGKRRENIRRFQYTAIDDATRVRALKIYEKHNQINATDFVDHIIENPPSVSARYAPKTDMRSKPSSTGMSKIRASAMPISNAEPPQMNCKVERSDQEEFYQLLSYKGDIDCLARLDE